MTAFKELPDREPHAPQDGASADAASRASRRRMIRNILIGTPAVIAASARAARAGHKHPPQQNTPTSNNMYGN